MLLAGMTEAESAVVRFATRTGAPLGSREFIAGLERERGRRLRVLARGRPKHKTTTAEPVTAESSLFGRGEASGKCV